MRNISFFILIMVFLTSCTNGEFKFPFEVGRVMNRLHTDLQQSDVYVGDPVFVRIFKEEHVLELWMRSEEDSRYKLVKAYPICRWSGNLGPKFYEGDLQAPEGFYATDLLSLNPQSRYHLSFNINYPNDYDRSYGRTGSFIMVHGDCVSEGCYAMTDRGIEEIYILVERALGAGQAQVPIHIFPFRMTQERMAREVTSPNYPFWQNLKEGYDFFETYGRPPYWGLNYGEYDFY